ncbi:hypothetical protein JKP88DRAFT_264646 [Tribonema minus]|uniref:Uncharacterized protein n=1 Tax=Tribonema minus TaxID=303371 RepID=A0A835YRR9_9STRA|nr:hypothetical protein JKP88DRAFT_264646 [Tribonema minus]
MNCPVLLGSGPYCSEQQEIPATELHVASLRTFIFTIKQSALVQALRLKVREQELVADVLKAEVATLRAWSPDQVNDLVIAKTCGGPKRFRPKTREELQNELSALEKKHVRALLKLKQAAEQGGGGGGGGVDAAAAAAPSVQEGPEVAVEEAPRFAPSMEDVAALMEELEELRVAVKTGVSAPLHEYCNFKLYTACFARSRAKHKVAALFKAHDINLQHQATELERLRSHNSELVQEGERLGHAARRNKDLRGKNAALVERVEALAAAHDEALEELHHAQTRLALYEEGAKMYFGSVQHLEVYSSSHVSKYCIFALEELHHAQTRLALYDEEAKLEADALRTQLASAVTEAAAAAEREASLAGDAEAGLAAAVKQAAEARHQLRARTVALEAAQGAARDAEKRTRRLQDAHDKLAADVAHLGKDAAAAETFRERLRAVNAENKTLRKRVEELAAARDAERERALRLEVASSLTASAPSQPQLPAVTPASPVPTAPASPQPQHSPTTRGDSAPPVKVLTEGDRARVARRGGLRGAPGGDRVAELADRRAALEACSPAQQALLDDLEDLAMDLSDQASLLSSQLREAQASEAASAKECGELRGAITELQHQVSAAKVVTRRLSATAPPLSTDGSAPKKPHAPLGAAHMRQVDALRAQLAAAEAERRAAARRCEALELELAAARMEADLYRTRHAAAAKELAAAVAELEAGGDDATAAAPSAAVAAAAATLASVPDIQAAAAARLRAVEAEAVKCREKREQLTVELDETAQYVVILEDRLAGLGYRVGEGGDHEPGVS